MTRPASLLHPASYAHCWVCTWMGLLTCWLGFDQVGLEPFPVRTHWVTTTSSMSFRPIPRFRAYLGATSAWFGAGRDRDAGLSCQLHTAAPLLSHALCPGRLSRRSRAE